MAQKNVIFEIYIADPKLPMLTAMFTYLRAKRTHRLLTKNWDHCETWLPRTAVWLTFQFTALTRLDFQNALFSQYFLYYLYPNVEN